MKIAAIGLADFIDGADIGMVQRRRRPRLTLKALQRRGVFRQLSGQELEGDVAAEVDVLSFVDHTHATAAKLVQDPVVGDGFALHQPGSSKMISRW